MRMRRREVPTAPPSPAPAADISVTCRPAGISAGAGCATSGCTVTSRNGFSGVVTLSCASPAGFTVWLRPGSAQPGRRRLCPDGVHSRRGSHPPRQRPRHRRHRHQRKPAADNDGDGPDRSRPPAASGLVPQHDGGGLCRLCRFRRESAADLRPRLRGRVDPNVCLVLHADGQAGGRTVRSRGTPALLPRGGAGTSRPAAWERASPCRLRADRRFTPC